MPVRFKGESEYDGHYKGLSSPKTSFDPSSDQFAPVAGVSSPKHSYTMGFQAEPPLQRKKKPIPLVTTSTTKMFDPDVRAPDDYMILGSQEKFAPDNVVYRDYLVKNRDRVLGTTYVAPSRRDDDVARPIQPKSKPLRQIDFDTGARKPVPQEEGVRVNGAASQVNLSKTRVIAKEPNSTHVSPPTIATSAASPALPQPKPSQPSASGNAKLSVPKLKPSAQEPSKTVRTQGKKPQDPSVGDDYVMKYRAGVAPPRHDIKRRSEYAYKYEWKNPVKNTPLLAADQVVHSSSVPLGRPKRSQSEPRAATKPVRMSSEYAKQYKEWKYKPVVESQTVADRNVQTIIKGSQLRRSRSDANLTPDRRKAAGSPSRIFHDNSRLTKSLNPQKPFFPHKRAYSWTSEYNSNFQPFSNYQYAQGAWKNVVPPHVMPRKETPTAPSTSSSWTAEVRELREKAYEYRRRSLGTHFSRQHVGQLLSENGKLWDQVSDSESLNALDLQEPNKPSSDKKREVAGKASELSREKRATWSSEDKPERSRKPSDERKSRVPHRLAWSEDGDRSTSASDSVRSIRSSSSPALSSISDSRAIPRPPRQNFVTQASQTGTIDSRAVEVDSQADSYVSEATSSTENGRVQTPELVEEQQVRRHHLDVTTPSRHGLLLAAPAHKTPPASAATSPRVNQVHKVKQQKPANHTMKAAAERKTKYHQPLQVTAGPHDSPSKTRVMMSPTYGKPTPDTHLLLDDEQLEPRDVLLETRYVQSPISKDQRLRTIREGAGATYSTKACEYFSPPQRNRDDDEMSETSILSMVSTTSSLASEILDRASKRKNFWK